MQINATTSRQLKFHSVVKFSTLRHSSNYVKRNVARFEAIAAQIRLPREDRRHLKSECFIFETATSIARPLVHARALFSLSLSVFFPSPRARRYEIVRLFFVLVARDRGQLSNEERRTQIRKEKQMLSVNVCVNFDGK